MDLEASKLGVECVGELLAGHGARKVSGFARDRSGVHAIDASLQLAARLMLRDGVQDHDLDFPKALACFQLQLFLRHRRLGFLVGGGVEAFACSTRALA
jgi:hypothetical protein